MRSQIVWRLYFDLLKWADNIDDIVEFDKNMVIDLYAYHAYHAWLRKYRI